MTIEGKSLLTTLLTTTISFINGHMQCIDAVYHELIVSSFTYSADWALRASLGSGVATSIGCPRTEILKLLAFKNPEKVTFLHFPVLP